MTKTFDQICKGILGEMIAPTMAPGQPPKPGQPAQQTGQPPAQQTPPNQAALDDDTLIQMIMDAKDKVAATTILNTLKPKSTTQPSQPAQQPNAATNNKPV